MGEGRLVTPCKRSGVILRGVIFFRGSRGVTLALMSASAAAGVGFAVAAVLPSLLLVNEGRPCSCGLCSCPSPDDLLGDRESEGESAPPRLCDNEGRLVCNNVAKEASVGGEALSKKVVRLR